jgi:NitT/TauT family transport system ATP-binding protein
MTTSTSAVSGCFVNVNGVSKSFSRGGETRMILQDVSLNIRAGEILSIVGRSGAGKSTLLRLIAGLLSPDAGRVSIDRETADHARLAKHVGFMPQSPALLPWLSVAKNVALVQRVNSRSCGHELDVDEALRSVGLHAYRDAFPQQLSGGMQHRVALARALAVGGPLLVLDEPFASLDELTRASLYGLVLETWRVFQRTIVVVTHNLDEAMLLSDRVAILGGSPAAIVEVVDVHGDRPRREALDRGDYAQALGYIRQLLAGSEQ